MRDPGVGEDDFFEYFENQDDIDDFYDPPGEESLGLSADAPLSKTQDNLVSGIMESKMLQRTLSTRTCDRISFENEVLRCKHCKNCESGPSQVPWKVRFKCESCFSCLSCLYRLSFLSRLTCGILLHRYLPNFSPNDLLEKFEVLH